MKRDAPTCADIQSSRSIGNFCNFDTVAVTSLRATALMAGCCYRRSTVLPNRSQSAPRYRANHEFPTSHATRRPVMTQVAKGAGKGIVNVVAASQRMRRRFMRGPGDGAFATRHDRAQGRSRRPASESDARADAVMCSGLAQTVQATLNTGTHTRSIEPPPRNLRGRDEHMPPRHASNPALTNDRQTRSTSTFRITSAASIDTIRTQTAQTTPNARQRPPHTPERPQQQPTDTHRITVHDRSPQLHAVGHTPPERTGYRDPISP
jgi:hypothetical protein